MPLGEGAFDQVLVRLTRRPGDVDRVERLGHARFVPLIGAEGWHSKERSHIEDGCSVLATTGGAQTSR